MTWVSPADAPALELTPEERADVNDVLDAAAAWAAGDLPFYEAARIGRLGSPAHTRYIAIRATPKEDPRWRDLMALFDVLIESQGYVITRQGVFTKYDIRESNEQVERATQHIRVAA